MSLIAVNKALPARTRRWVTLASFGLPILLWCLVSYVPFIWHPMVEITAPGGVSYFREGMLVDKPLFAREFENMAEQG
ncbi:MAG: nitrate ABC transporter permease, partial [Thalassolituus sp.]